MKFERRNGIATINDVLLDGSKMFCNNKISDAISTLMTQ